MKNIVYVLLLNVVFGLSISLSKAQNNNTWILGDNGSPTKCGINFNNNFHADTFSVATTLSMHWSIVSISDSIGQLQFYSNGIDIFNRFHTPLSNAENFNPGLFSSHDSLYGLSIFDGLICVPNPDQRGRYFLFHESADTIFSGLQTQARPLNLRYSEIDMHLSSDSGGVIPNIKSKFAIIDSLTIGRLAAVKHANGRDWWVICHKYNSNIFYEILVTPDSIHQAISQNIGLNDPPTMNYYGQAIFSDDGSKYAIQILATTVELFDFDRCTGQLSNPIYLNISDSTYALTGESFSPTGRFLYINNNFKIYQFDLASSNVVNSKQQIAVLDTTHFQGYFRTNRLGPDGRIYICYRSGDSLIHYIENPDSLGLNCNVHQFGFVIPSGNAAYGLPNFPNYDLGALSGGDCDTLNSIISDIKSEEFWISPNPCHDYISLHANLKGHSVILIRNTLGKILLQSSFDNENISIDWLPSGVYFISIINNEKQFLRKIVKY